MGVAGLNMAINGFTSVNTPFFSVNPCGMFIKAFIDVMKKADAVDPIAVGTSSSRCRYLLRNLSQVYR
ncbi:hypothetical protein D3C80_1804150 [compost metagenome]